MVEDQPAPVRCVGRAGERDRAVLGTFRDDRFGDRGRVRPARLDRRGGLLGDAMRGTLLPFVSRPLRVDPNTIAASARHDVAVVVSEQDRRVVQRVLVAQDAERRTAHQGEAGVPRG